MTEKTDQRSMLASCIINEFDRLVKIGSELDKPLWQIMKDRKVGAPCIDQLQWYQEQDVETGEISAGSWQLQYKIDVSHEGNLAVMVERDETFVEEVLYRSENYDISSIPPLLRKNEDDERSYELYRIVYFSPIAEESSEEEVSIH